MALTEQLVSTLIDKVDRIADDVATVRLDTRELRTAFDVDKDKRRDELILYERQQGAHTAAIELLKVSVEGLEADRKERERRAEEDRKNDRDNRFGRVTALLATFFAFLGALVMKLADHPFIATIHKTKVH